VEPKKHLTLSELNHRIRETIEEHFPHPLWVVAEIIEMKINASGHCYLELIEKKPDSDLLAAKARATIWAFTFRMLKPYFETTAGRPLAPGLKVLVQAEISFHEVFGLSLNIKDIDPAYTVGEMVLKRKEIIERLQKEGILDMNRRLSFPLVPQNIAIISSETAAGYQDFVHQITNNPWGYQFNLVLFPSIMQGAGAEDTLIQALEDIYDREDEFDVVIIIRGGGSQADLSNFDNYRVAEHVAQFPLPVLTGIGHEKDETVTDLVAYTNLKTPTAVAEFILDRVRNFEERIIDTSGIIFHLAEEQIAKHINNLRNDTYEFNNLLLNKLSGHARKLDVTKQKFYYLSQKIIQGKKHQLSLYVSNIKQDTDRYLTWHHQKTDMFVREIPSLINQFFSNKDHQLTIFDKSLAYLDPLNILRRGYSITRRYGHAIKNSEGIRPGEILSTKLFEGEIKSKVIK